MKTARDYFNESALAQLPYTVTEDSPELIVVEGTFGCPGIYKFALCTKEERVTGIRVDVRPAGYWSAGVMYGVKDRHGVSIHLSSGGRNRDEVPQRPSCRDEFRPGPHPAVRAHGLVTGGRVMEATCEVCGAIFFGECSIRKLTREVLDENDEPRVVCFKCLQRKDPVTILDVAKARGVEVVDGMINASEFARVGLSVLGGCEVCGAALSAADAYPSRSGYWRCRECLRGTGFATVEEVEGC